MELLIDQCPYQGCGATKDFVMGCLSQNWSEEFIQQQKYLDYNPDDYHGGDPRPFSMLNLPDFTPIMERDLDFGNINRLHEFFTKLTILIHSNGYVGIELGDHCFVICLIDGKHYIIDSYVHSGLPELSKYNRTLGKREFDLDEFKTLLQTGSVEIWNTLFHSIMSNITLDSIFISM